MSVTFPEHDIELLSGRHVTIKPWSLGLGRLMRKRIVKLFRQIQESRGNLSEVDLGALLEVGEEQIYEIVRDTVEWTDAQMDELAYEDLLTLAQGVLDVCVLRKDGGGVGGKLLGLLGTVYPQAAIPSANLDPKMAAQLEEVRKLKNWSPEKPTSESPEPSPSSPAAGEPTPSD